MSEEGKLTKKTKSRLGSFVNNIIPGWIKRTKNKVISKFTNSTKPSFYEVEDRLEIPVLMIGSGGSGKSTLIKQMRMLSEGKRKGTFHQELSAEKVYLQYDVVSGVLKVIERMISRYINEEAEVTISAKERAVFNSVTEKLKRITSAGDFLRDEQENTAGQNTMSRIEGIRNYELPLSRKEWRKLELISQRDQFVETMKERFLPAIETTGKPLKVSDGFARLMNIPDIWAQIRNKNPPLSSYLLIRKPNGGLLTKKAVKSINTDVEETIGFTEYPGRIESFVDNLALLNEDLTRSNFQCIVLTVSYADFDLMIDTEVEQERAFDVILKLVGELKNDLRTTPIYVVFTKGEVLKDKVKYYRNLNILEARLDFPLDPDVSANASSIAAAIMDNIRTRFMRSLKKIWLDKKVVFMFPRVLKLEFDAYDGKEIFNNIVNLSRHRSTRV